MRKLSTFAVIAIAAFAITSCRQSRKSSTTSPEIEEPDPAEIKIGEQLFLETRFSQFFYANFNGKVNSPLDKGDPRLEKLQTTAAPLDGPFKGQSINCRTCHLVDEHKDHERGGMRSYADFARMSPVPEREDGALTTPRNSPALVNASLKRDVPLFLHFDGEFVTMKDLCKETMLGRNYGWFPNERAAAVSHIAQVVRSDNGSGELAKEFSNALPYSTVLTGTDTSIPETLRLPPSYRIDIATAKDDQIVDAVSSLIDAYVSQLEFEHKSPYDLFLKQNRLPRKPRRKESNLDYSRRLRTAIRNLNDPQFVRPDDGEFKFHKQKFEFGPKEMEGLVVFLAEPKKLPFTRNDLLDGAVGNCIACHAAPNFTDFSFHNVGASQEAYDAVHGKGAFADLKVPDLGERAAFPKKYLPPSAAYPKAQGVFKSAVDAKYPERADLGLWSIFANPAVPKPQPTLRKLMKQQVSAEGGKADTSDDLLRHTIGRFKTPGLRDLGHSQPFFHTGRRNTLDDAVQHYIDFSQNARRGAVRNGSKELIGIALTTQDKQLLVAFLNSLNEDYE